MRSGRARRTLPRTEKYECDRCGASCRTLIVEADYLDVVREPRLLEADDHWRSKSLDAALEDLRDDTKAVLVACGSARPCRFLADEHRCSIYPTRPNVCVAMEAGDEQCQSARQDMELPPLAPIGSASGAAPSDP